MIAPYSYATLQQIRDELKAAKDDNSENGSVDEVRLEVTRRIDAEKRYSGVPVTKTVHIDLGNPRHFDHPSGRLLLPEPMLEVTSVTDADGSTLTVWDGQRATFDAAEILPYPHPSEPITMLIRRSGTGGLSRWDSTSGSLISIEGVWGWHPDYAHAWISSGATLTAAAGAALDATQLTLSAVTGQDSYGYRPAFSSGQVIRVSGDDEIMIVLGMDEGGLNVLRAQLGTAVEALANGAALDIWKPDPLLVRACRRWASYAYRRRGGRFNDYVVDGIGQLVGLPNDVPPEVRNILDQLPNFTRARVRAI